MSSNSISPGEIRLFKATKKGREARIAAATEKAHLEAEAIGFGSPTRFPKKRNKKKKKKKRTKKKTRIKIKPNKTNTQMELYYVTKSKGKTTYKIAYFRKKPLLNIPE